MKRSRVVFIDLLALLVLTMLVTMIVRQPIKQSEIEERAEFLIELSWDDHSASDVDLWFRAPDGQVVSFQNKNRGIYALDRDDLGARSDTIRLPDGTVRIISVNREVITMRGWTQGTYTVNIHLYTQNESAIPASVTWYRLNPFQIVAERSFTLTELGQEETVASITLDAAGTIIGRDMQRVPFASKGGPPF